MYEKKKYTMFFVNRFTLRGMSEYNETVVLASVILISNVLRVFVNGLYFYQTTATFVY